MELFLIAILSMSISGFLGTVVFPPNWTNSIYLIKKGNKVGYLLPAWALLCLILGIVSTYFGVTYYGW